MKEKLILRMIWKIIGLKKLSKFGRFIEIAPMFEGIRNTLVPSKVEKFFENQIIKNKWRCYEIS